MIYFALLANATFVVTASGVGNRQGIGNMRNKKTYTVALGGVTLALAVIALYLTSVVPVMDLTFYAVTSICVCVMIAETGVRGGLLVYGGAGLLGFLLIPGKLGILPYLCFYGIFPVIKCLAEKIHNKPLSIAVKAVFASVVLVTAYTLFRGLFFAHIHLPGEGTAAVVLFGIIMYVCYDYILSGVIRIYRNRIKREKDIKLS